jgi:FlaA1/EpsC-like NDP-sugar epimerase
MHCSLRKILHLLPLMAAAAASLAAAFLLRFEFAIPGPERRMLEVGLPVFVFVKTLVFLFFRLHRISWRLVGVFDLVRIAGANACASAASFAVMLALFGPAFPRSVYIIDGALCFLAAAGLPFTVRLYKEMPLRGFRAPEQAKSVLIYGAGAAGLTLVREIRANPRLGMKVAGFLDDDPRKRNGAVAGIPIVGTGRDAARLVAQYRRRQRSIAEIVIAMPSATGRQMRSAIANCRAARVPFKTVPSLGELLNGKVLSRQIRDVSVNDLLGREPVRIEENRIREAVEKKVVLVTGGCGSIGSELCRQLVRFNPAKLVIFDQAESEMFMLALELRSRNGELNLATEIGDIRHAVRVEEVLAKHRPEILFHAAAYKHVPLMEANAIEAVENNVIGTYNVASAAHRQSVRKFVMISTDKAVNPTSVMGATKRAAELIVSAMPLDGSLGGVTTFVSVRFGNVLASAGSVVQVFQRQIAAGGPVTVTHRDMRRYFMSIPEAVQLVLQASTMGKGSEVFVLDMGEPVLILELARNMIRLAGLTPGEDIDIRFTGTRPGEKLFEELKLDGEDILPTYHEKIKIFRSHGPGAQYLGRWLYMLRKLIEERNAENVRAHLAELVPEYVVPAAADGSVQVRRASVAGAGASSWS